jgi:hypothetical protein
VARLYHHRAFDGQAALDPVIHVHETCASVSLTPRPG